MRVLADQKKLMNGGLPPDITQVDKTPAPVDGTAINGRFVVPVLEGYEFQLTDSSHILPVDGSDINSQSFAYLLASFPMYGHLFFNPLLTAADLDATDGGIDFAKTFRFDTPDTPPDPPIYYSSRLQTGREASSIILPHGNYPTHTALLPQNETVDPVRPGLLITKAIDLSPHTTPEGTDDFCVYWRLYDFATTDDHAGDFGVVGDNTPAIRRIYEADQEPDDFEVYLSPDDGVHWCRVSRLDPIAFTTKTTSIRLAFMNRTANKIHIANYGVLF